MSTTVPQSIPTAPGGREPISRGAPPGAPPEGPPFQSALESESARTASAEGQQQSHSHNPSPDEGEQASTAEAFDRLARGSAQPSRHSGHRAPPRNSEATAGSALSATNFPGSALTPATALQGGTVTKELATDAATGPTTAGAVALPAGAEGIPNSDAPPAPGGSPPAGAGEDTPISGTPPAPGGSPSASAAGALTATAVAHDDAPLSSHANHTDAAPASPQDGTPAGGVLAITGSDALLAGPGTQAHSAPSTPPTGDLPIPHTSSAPPASTGTGDLVETLNSPTPSAGTNAGGRGSSNADLGGSSSDRGGSWSQTGADPTLGQVHLRGAGNAGAHDKLWVPNPAQASTAADGVSGLPENTASPLLSATLEGNPAAPPAELGSAAYGVGLQEAIESLHGTIQLTARQGLSQARISLHPDELGEIRINLTQTAQGLLARVTAESPAAAQALAAAHAQLRQSLSSLGINLARLDIGHHDPSTQSGGTDHKGDNHNGATRGDGSASSRPSRRSAIADPTYPAIDPPLAEGPAPSTAAQLRGTLIDVLA
jgi:flagellar hook-length control protein FliK